MDGSPITRDLTPSPAPEILPPDHPVVAGRRTGVLLVNLGTPEAPTPAADRSYLAEFLSDRRVVDYQRILWLQPESAAAVWAHHFLFSIPAGH